MTNTIIIKKNKVNNLFSIDAHTVEFGGLGICNVLMTQQPKEKALAKLRKYIKNNKSIKFNFIRKNI